MAEIVGSLFGITADQYERDLARQDQARAIQMAGLEPGVRGAAMIQYGASQLGRGIGSLLGGQDPQLQLISARNQIARQIDPSNPESFMNGSRMLAQMGDMQGANALADAGRKAQAELALVGQRNAAAQASIAQATRERGPTGDVAKAMRVGEITRALQTPELNPLERSGLEAELSSLSPTKAKEPTTNEITNAAAFAATKGEPGTPAYTDAFRSKFNELIAPKEAKGPAFGADAERASKAKFGKPFADLTSAEAAEVNKDLAAQGLERAKATASTTTVKLPAQESEFEKGLGGGQSKLVLENKAAAQDAAEILRTNQVGRDLLKSGAITGTGANLFVGLNNALAQAGLDFGYADAAANSQAYVAAMGANVGRIIKQFGAGTGLSNADREYAAKMAAGEITLTETALRRILDINDRAANRAIDLHNRNVQSIKTNIPLTVEKPVFNRPAPSASTQIPGQSPAPTAAAPAPAAAPMYARNPQTNERVMSTDGGKTWTKVR
jgi:hypothetical protein